MDLFLPSLSSCGCYYRVFKLLSALILGHHIQVVGGVVTDRLFTFSCDHAIMWPHHFRDSLREYFLQFTLQQYNKNINWWPGSLERPSISNLMISLRTAKGRACQFEEPFSNLLDKHVIPLTPYTQGLPLLYNLIQYLHVFLPLNRWDYLTYSEHGRG